MCLQNFGGEIQKKESTWKTRTKKIILKCIFRQWDGSMGWIDMAQIRERWWALVDAVTWPRIPYNAVNFLTSWRTVSFSRSTSLHAVSHSLRICRTYITDNEFFLDLARNRFILQEYTYWREIFVTIGHPAFRSDRNPLRCRCQRFYNWVTDIRTSSTSSGHYRTDEQKKVHTTLRGK